MSPKNAESVNSSYISWAAIFAGTAIALAISIILISFGNSIGLSMNAHLTDEKAKGMVFGIGLWVFWTQLMSSLLGGYFSGKGVGNAAGLTEHEAEVRDGIHGLVTWALSTVLLAIGAALITFLSSLAPHHTNDVISTNPDIVKRAGIIFGFGVAASSLVSAVAAWWAATMAGEHRNNQTDFSSHISFRRSKRK